MCTRRADVSCHDHALSPNPLTKREAACTSGSPPRFGSPWGRRLSRPLPTAPSRSQPPYTSLMSAVDCHVVQRTGRARLRATWARQGHPQKGRFLGVSRSLGRTAGMTSIRMPGRVRLVTGLDHCGGLWCGSYRARTCVHLCRRVELAAMRRARVPPRPARHATQSQSTGDVLRLPSATGDVYSSPTRAS